MKPKTKLKLKLKLKLKMKLKMKPEDKVPTLKQCKRLVELGVDIDTDFKWVGQLADTEYHIDLIYHPNLWMKDLDVYPAPDVAELGELLPTIGEKNNPCNLNWLSGVDPMSCNPYTVINGGNIHQEFNEDTEAQARCAALIWLVENKHIKAGDIG